METPSEKIPEHKNMADIIDNMAVETYEMEESAFNMFDNIVHVKKETVSVIASSETTMNMDEMKTEETHFEMVDINNMVEFENEDATYEPLEEANDPISDSGKMVEVTFQVAPMTHRISEPTVNAVDARENINVTVNSLKKQVFYDLPLESKIAIKRLGRPTPSLKIVHHLRDSPSENHKRTYQLVIYDKNSWICGCETTNKLFCFPCLLLSNRDTPQYNQWVDSGVSDLQHLGFKMNEHETSRLHFTAVSAFANIDAQQPLARKTFAGVKKLKINAPHLKNDPSANRTNNEIHPNTVSSLKKQMFSTLSHGQKLRIKQAGRPTPVVELFTSSKNMNRPVSTVFNKDMYSKFAWICGCEITNKLFCFPCLLSSNRDPIWTEKGFSGLSRLHENIHSHECSQLHLCSMLELNLLGKANISQQLENSYRKFVDDERSSINSHNKLVVRNRSVLSKIIDCMKMSSLFESTHQARSDPGNDSNPSVFRDVMNLSCEIDASLKRDIEENSFLFKHFSKEFQNYLLHCMLLVCQENIIKEMSMSNYVSVIVEETTRISSSFMLAIIFRYVLANGKPVERFFTFIEPLTQDVGHVGRLLRGVIQSAVPNRSQLVSQSYDGGCSIISGHLNEMQTIIKQHYTYAFYVHCYAHDINLVISQATSQNQQVRIFFSNLSEVIDFWCSTPQCSVALSHIFAKRKYPQHEVSFLSNISSVKTRPVDCIYRYGKDLIACTEEIEATSKHSATICRAGHIRRVLNDREFLFWIKVFYSVMPHVQNLMMTIHHGCADKREIKTNIDSFLEVMYKEERIYAVDDENLEKKRSRDENNMTTDEKKVRQIACKEIVDRYSFFTPHSAESLFDSKQFIKYQKSFPLGLFEDTTRDYPFFDVVRLNSELQLIYKQQDFIQSKGVLSLMLFLTENDLQSTFPETYKLLSLVLTIPMTTNEEGRCFDTHKRIENLFQPSMSYDNINITALAMLSVEQNMIRNIPNFNHLVIELFSTQTEWAKNFSLKQSD